MFGGARGHAGTIGGEPHTRVTGFVGTEQVVRILANFGTLPVAEFNGSAEALVSAVAPDGLLEFRWSGSNNCSRPTPVRSAAWDDTGVEPLQTPDGRYIIVRGRLWRAANPNLPVEEREALVRTLMAARRAVRAAQVDGDAAGLSADRATVDAAKIALGERGPVWWQDGAEDLNRHLVRNTPYRAWYAQIAGSKT